jgi:leader peptidase (prepilin peptidase) / N-methyltransferase
LDLLIAAAFFLAGLTFGSFLNVCISRIPNDLSIVSPGSYCPGCKTPILWRDNIPVLSWVILRGRCRKCGERFSLRYPAVELLTAALFLVSYALFGFTWLGLRACVFCFLVVGLIFMDAETGLLPHEFTYPGIAAGFAFALVGAFDAAGTAFLLRVFGQRDVLSGRELWLLDSVVAAAFGVGFFFLAWALYYLVRKREGMGFGDFAFIAMIGAFSGLKLTILVVFLSPILTTLFAASLLAKRPENGEAVEGPGNSSRFLARSVPFGVFLGASALVSLFFGRQIWEWYLGLFG